MILTFFVGIFLLYFYFIPCNLRLRILSSVKGRNAQNNFAIMKNRSKYNKSDVNISVFSETPHGLASDNEVILNYIKAASKKGFKKQTGLPNDWRGKTVVEFGCGAGMKILPLALNGANIIGIDGSEIQLARIKKNAKALGIKGNFICSKLEEVNPKSIPNADLVICSAVIHHVHEWRRLLEIMSEVLKEGGYLYLTWGDWTIHLSGFNIKNQIAYRLGWNNNSRMRIGKFLFGWWDKGRNVLNLEDNSFFADLYSAYYIPISYTKMCKYLNKNGIEIMNALPPHNIEHYIRYHEFAGTNSKFLSFFKKIEKTQFAFFINILLRLRHYTIPKHGPRIISSQKNSKILVKPSHR